MTPTHTSHQTKVVGVSFQSGYPKTFHKWAALPKGRLPSCKLKREPDNPHDPNAVAVVVGRVRVGHLPRDVASWVAPRMDAGEMFAATVETVDVYPDKPHSPSMTINVIAPITESRTQ